MRNYSDLDQPLFVYVKLCQNKFSSRCSKDNKDVLQIVKNGCCHYSEVLGFSLNFKFLLACFLRFEKLLLVFTDLI
jgi:hypothetical protein